MDIADKLTDYITGLDDRVVKAEAWVASEIPAYVSELLAYHTASAVLWIMFYLIAIAAMLYAYRNAIWVADDFRKKRDTLKAASAEEGISKKDAADFAHASRQADDLRGATRGLAIVFVCIAFGLLIGVAYHGSTIIKIRIAPRVYVVDYLRSEFLK